MAAHDLFDRHRPPGFPGVVERWLAQKLADGVNVLLASVTVGDRHRRLRRLPHRMRGPEQRGGLLGTAHAMRELTKAPVSVADRPRHQQDIESIRELLGEPAFTDAWEAGKALTVEEVLRLLALP